MAATLSTCDETLEKVHVLLRVGAVVPGAQVLAEEQLDLIERLLRDDRRPVRVDNPIPLALGEPRLLERPLLLVDLLLRDVRGVAQEPPHARVPEPLRRMGLAATGRVALRPKAPVVEGRDGLQDRAGLKVRLESSSHDLGLALVHDEGALLLAEVVAQEHPPVPEPPVSAGERRR